MSGWGGVTGVGMQYPRHVTQVYCGPGQASALHPQQHLGPLHLMAPIPARVMAPHPLYFVQLTQAPVAAINGGSFTLSPVKSLWLRWEA